MKTKTFILLCLLTSSLLSAQNVSLDIKPHFLGVRGDSLLLSMDISVEIEEMSPKNAVILTPVLANQDRKILLPAIQLNGKQKQKLYLRNQILRKKKDSRETTDRTFLITGIDDAHPRTIAYRTALPAEEWMNNATVYLRRTIVSPEGELSLKDTLIIAPQYAVYPTDVNPTGTTIPSSTPTAATPTDYTTSPAIAGKALKYKGAYISPASDDVDIRNQKELNFNLEEAKIMADINPQMLSLRELYTVALSYNTESKAKFYQIINISVKLYPVHPVANLNAAAAAIEQGDTKSAGKFLSMGLHEGLAYKSCRGVYELMTGNTYEGIRILKAAKAEGSEEAAYNLNVFFENNKRP